MKSLETAPKSPYLRVIPLGGLDQFGMNCCLLETEGRLLIMDCGLTFPEQGHFGIDYILPDWTYVFDNLDRIEGIVLTHGHEDHIGALPYLLDQVDLPLYGGALTLAMVKRKLEDADVADVEYNIVSPRDTRKVGPFNLEFFHVNHSIPNAMAVAIETPAGKVLFTGDWKIDQTPLGEPVFDLQGMARLGEEGLLAVLGDSTNVDVPGYSVSETEVNQNLTRLLETAKGRVFIALFSSNMHRVSGLLASAAACGRKVCLVGRSLERNFKLGLETGFVPPPPDGVFIDINQMDRFQDDQLLVVSTGSQAEPRSTLTRLAFDDHHQISLRSTDTVIISARVIPGNETSVNKMLDALSRKGIEIITKRSQPVHGSGHGHREELKLLLNLTRPQYVVPMHGDFRVRRGHSALAKELHIPAMVINDGDVLQFEKSKPRVIGKVPYGRMVVDGKFMGDMDDVQIRDRKRLASTGIIVAFAVLDRETGDVSSGPDLMQHGFLAGVPESDQLMKLASEFANAAVKELPPKARKDASEVGEAIRLATRRFFQKELRRKPVVIPIVHEL